MGQLTSNSEHLQPVSLLNDTNKYDEADDNEGNDGELLGEIIHIELQRRTLLFDVLHH